MSLETSFVNTQRIRIGGLVGEKQLVGIIASSYKISLIQFPL